MIEILTGLPPHAVGFKLSGKLHDEDYKTFVPLVDAEIAKEGKVNVLAMFHDFHGWDAKALWDDIKFSTTHCTKIKTHRAGRREHLAKVDGRGLQAVHDGQNPLLRRGGVGSCEGLARRGVKCRRSRSLLPEGTCPRALILQPEHQPGDRSVTVPLGKRDLQRRSRRLRLRLRLLLFRLLQPDQRPPFLPVGAEMHQHRHFVVRQVVKAGLHDDGVVALHLHAHALRLLVNGPDQRRNLVGEEVVEVAANDAVLVDGQLDDFVGLGLRRLSDYGEHAQRQPLFVRRRPSGIGKLLGLVVVLVGRGHGFVAVIDGVAFVGHVPAIVVVAALAAASAIAARGAPAPPAPGGGGHGPLAGPPGAGVTAVPAGRECAPSRIGAIDRRPGLAADELAVDEGRAASGRDDVPGGAANAGDRADLAGAVGAKTAARNGAGISPLVPRRGKRTALPVSGGVGVAAADIANRVAGGISAPLTLPPRTAESVPLVAPRKLLARPASAPPAV